MGEQRFKVGDWVRVNDNRGAPMDYKVGDVCQVSAVRKDLVYCGDAAMFAKRFEPWQPRVGERVRYNGKSTTYSEKELVGLEGEVTELKGKLVNVKWDKTIVDGIRTGGAKYIENLEPVLADATPKPTTLKIEAGSFYKTRDGRKVGPMLFEEFGDGEPWHTSDTFRWWSNDGTRRDGSNGESDDIIAEWIDEPVVEKVAKPSNDNAQPKFKVGDRVKIVSNSRESYLDKRIGSFFTIITKDGPNNTGWSGSSEENPYWWPAQDLELANITPSTPTTTIVALIENGQPKPSSTPHVHASTGAAEKEARRLAAKYKGKQFGVFTLATTHEEAAPVYDHKWQNMAALGLKVDAIRELRAVAGLDLLSAKRAVEAFDAAA